MMFALQSFHKSSSIQIPVKESCQLTCSVLSLPDLEPFNSHPRHLESSPNSWTQILQLSLTASSLFLDIHSFYCPVIVNFFPNSVSSPSLGSRYLSCWNIPGCNGPLLPLAITHTATEGWLSPTHPSLQHHFLQELLLTPCFLCTYHSSS